VDSALAACAAVRAASPAGARLKVVVARGRAGEVEAVLAPLGARLAPAQPDFEDVFLAHVGEAA
ncbi:MAG TPA: ABC transporter ATP-binding protein, partial [Anaeromyxobacteraceae bacterium]|nr:ABC transporter ATP-binding protein [Anaeromyxobacteraceae bacterium]